MRPRRTPLSDRVFKLPGGNEDNDLWVQRIWEDGGIQIRSVWEFDVEERAEIAAGANVELCVFGDGTPPVSLAVTHTPLGRG